MDINSIALHPEFPQDVLLFNTKFPASGQILLGHSCGVFLRQEDDHKFVAVDDEIREDMTAADLSSLNKTSYGRSDSARKNLS